jgi:hypothetical protein
MGHHLAITATPLAIRSPVFAYFRVLNRKILPPIPAADPKAALAIDLDNRYRPLSRLLMSEDLRFLKTQAGYRRYFSLRFKRDRLRISMRYLRCLVVDFQLIHAASRTLASCAGAPRNLILDTLQRRELSFWQGMSAIAVTLALFICDGRSVNLTEPLMLTREAQSDLRLWNSLVLE